MSLLKALGLLSVATIAFTSLAHGKECTVAVSPVGFSSNPYSGNFTTWDQLLNEPFSTILTAKGYTPKVGAAPSSTDYELVPNVALTSYLFGQTASYASVKLKNAQGEVVYQDSADSISYGYTWFGVSVVDPFDFKATLNRLPTCDQL